MGFSSEVLTIEQTGHVATLWLDRPEKRNAMGRAFFDDLPLAMETLIDDPDVWAVVLAARGPAFTVGLDLKEMGGAISGGGGSGEGRPSSDALRRTAGYRSLKRMQHGINLVAECPKPVIAAVHGWCIGGGIDLITACDIRLAASDAQFTVRETKMAIVADLGTLQRLPKVVAAGHVAELAFTGKDITASRAREISLVNDVVDGSDAAVQAAALAMAEEIAANPPLVVQGVKQVLRASASGRSVDEGLDYVAVWNSAFLQSDDLVEAMTAFLEKRPPKFTGS